MKKDLDSEFLISGDALADDGGDASFDDDTAEEEEVVAKVGSPPTAPR